MAIFPFILQGMLLWLLWEIVEEIDVEDIKEEGPAIQFVVTALIVFCFDVFTFLTGPSLRCLYACCRINFSQHEIYPRTTKVLAWVLYLAGNKLTTLTHYTHNKKPYVM